MDFQYAVTFAGNEVLFWEDDNSGGGGGLAVGVDGSVMFQDLAYFTGNEVRGGGRGGGMENLGEAYFKRASYFMTNIATGECTPIWTARNPGRFLVSVGASPCTRSKPETQPRLPIVHTVSD